MSGSPARCTCPEGSRAPVRALAASTSNPGLWIRGSLTALTCVALVAVAAGCESTEQESARIGRAGAHLIASTGTLRLGGPNHGVRVSNVTLLSDAGRTAVAARLTVTDIRPQAGVPVLVVVSGAGGKVLYSNDIEGLEPSLQRTGLLRPGQGAWWVDDQVLSSQQPSAVHVRVGRAAAHAGSPPLITTGGVQLGKQAGLDVLNGTLTNHSAHTARKVPVFAVALRGGHVTAAGRAIVATLPGGSTAPVPFQIFLVGNPAGSSIQLTVSPTS